jgi:hypothetical protein
MTGEAYRAPLRDGPQVWINGERVRDVPSHPLFEPIVDIRARIDDAPGPGAVRRTDSPEARQRGVRASGNRTLAGEVLYRNFDFTGPLQFVQRAAGLSERVMGA